MAGMVWVGGWVGGDREAVMTRKPTQTEQFEVSGEAEGPLGEGRG